MIRRNITLDDGTPAWLLVSQVEHARISGELAQVWCDALSPEVIAAISHHDDGWAEWERAPHLDERRGRPLSFTEMPATDAIEIWNASIDAARDFGLLAGAIVDGHFVGLASGADHPLHSPMHRWQIDRRKQQADWLDQWHRAAPENTRQVADRAQQMLLTADLLSLWLCCDGPIPSDDLAVVPNSEIELRGARILGMYRFSTEEESHSHSSINWLGSLSPWPFNRNILRLESPAMAVPAAKYDSWAEVAAASRPLGLSWQLRQTLPAHGEC